MSRRGHARGREGTDVHVALKYLLTRLTVTLLSITRDVPFLHLIASLLSSEVSRVATRVNGARKKGPHCKFARFELHADRTRCAARRRPTKPSTKRPLLPKPSLGHTGAVASSPRDWTTSPPHSPLLVAINSPRRLSAAADAVTSRILWRGGRVHKSTVNMFCW